MTVRCTVCKVQTENTNSNPSQPYFVHSLGVIPLQFCKVMVSSETRMWPWQPNDMFFRFDT